MNNTYTVTIQLNSEQFHHFVDSFGPLVARLVVTVDGSVESDERYPSPAPEPVKTRAPRGSKVNDAILGALKDGAKGTKELKEALENAGLSAGSLSTGIATLQREGVIERVGEGTYGLVDHLKQAA